MLIEARLVWENDVLAIAHVPARGVVRLSDFAGLDGDSTIVHENWHLVCDRLPFAGARIELQLVASAPPLPPAKRELRTTKGVVLAAVVHAALLVAACVFHVNPDPGTQLDLLKTYVAKSEARSVGEAEGDPIGLRVKTRAPVDLEIGADAGEVFGSLRPDHGPRLSAMIYESDGTGGLGLSGVGEGGYDRVPGSGVEHASDAGSGGHRVGQVACRCDEMSTVNGRLPPEVIQRIVRQNFGRMRLCYETGLTRNPSLEGRMAVKFVISRSGEVTTAASEDHSFGDAAVTSCVERAFASLSFPQPEGGIVTVVYPLVFSS